MKKFVILLGVITSMFVLMGCASKGISGQGDVDVFTPAHHDYKGEVGPAKS